MECERVNKRSARVSTTSNDMQNNQDEQDNQNKQDSQDNQEYVESFNRSINNEVNYSNLPFYARPSAPPMPPPDQMSPLSRSEQVRQQDQQLAHINRRINNNPPNYDDMNAAYSIFDRQFGNIFDRADFLRKSYAILLGQFTFFVSLCAIFVYIPHLRRVFRKIIFDRIFVTSSIAIPLMFLLVFLAYSESFRRRFAVFTLFLITSCCSFLLSYTLTEQACKMMLSQVVAMDASLFTTMLVSYLLPRFVMRNLKQASVLPVSLAIYNLAMMRAIPSISFDRNWKYWMGSSAVLSYLGYNTMSVLNNDTLMLQKNEYMFAANSYYFNFDIFKSISQMFRHSPRNVYESI